MDEQIETRKYYYNFNNEVDEKNHGESRTISNLLNLVDYKNYKNEFTSIIKTNSNNNILELGCGLGIGITELSYFYNNNNYYCVNMPRKGRLANGYERKNYTNEYIINFMKTYGYDMRGKKNVNHYNHDLYDLSIFKESYFDLIYSQSTIGKSSGRKNKLDTIQLIDKILQKLKINGISLHHVDSIPYYNFEDRTISMGTNILKGVPIYYELYFADNKYCQAETNDYSEIMLYIKKLPDNNGEKKIINVKNNVNQIMTGSCLKSIIKYLTN